MPLVNIKKANKAAGKMPGKFFSVKVLTMDEELEFATIEVITEQPNI